MKILIFGGNGMLGHKLVQSLSQRFDVYSTIRGRWVDVEHFGLFQKERTFETINVLSHEDIVSTLESVRPDVVINCIGVIKQRANVNDVINTLEVNSLFPQRLSLLSPKFDFRLITISTDCVFDGQTGNYDDEAVPNALDLYGQSKHWGEVNCANCLTLRTSIIGRELNNSDSLIEWFISRARGTVEGYTRAIYSGFPTIVFADIIIDIVENHRSLSGVYNVSSDPVSKYELLFKFNEAMGLGIDLQKSDAFVIDRSLNSDRYRSLTGFAPENWDLMIRRLAADCSTYTKWKTQGY